MGSAGVGKVVFPVAGLGTRFLPATKAIPKEMLPLVDRPLIQIAIDEALAAGARTLIFITGRFEEQLKTYLKPAPELEAVLRSKNKLKILEQIEQNLPDHVECVFINQREPRGLGDAIYLARSLVGNEAFGVILPDDLIQSKPPGTLARMAKVQSGRDTAVIAVESVARALTQRYGIVSPAKTDGPVTAIEGLVEKPAPDRAPSNLAIVGRYILPPRIFELLERTEPGAGGEVQLTDAIAALLPDHPVLAYRFPGRRFDCGSKLGYVEATVAYALEDPELKKDFVDYLRSLGVSSRTNS